MVREVRVGDVGIGGDNPLVLIAGPCVVEEENLTLRIADELRRIAASRNLGLIFKASFDKANRTSLGSFRGPGLREGLRILRRVKEEIGLPVLSDVHEAAQIETASQILDALQIPAFLSRQTDLLTAAGGSGRAVNIKKGQFLSPWDMVNAVAKVESTGNRQVFLTERGTSFGYNNLVVDMRSLPIMRETTGCPVIFDGTHAVQLPGGAGSASGGERRFAGALSRAAVATGVDGLFWEVHENPDQALCDGPNSLFLADLPELLDDVLAIHSVVVRKPPADDLD